MRKSIATNHLAISLLAIRASGTKKRGKPLSDSAPHTEHMKEDLRLLLGCDGIIVPNRWRCSKGCEMERRVADACGIPVVGVIGETHDLQITNAI
jgi:hypothetical protein